MNLYLKNISLLFCIILLIAMGDCKKDKAQYHRPDFRDSLVGTYNCIMSHHGWYPTLDSLSANINWITVDTTIGPAIVTVTKAATDDSSIVINGITFTLSSANNAQIQYKGLDQFMSMAYFTLRNDSIWFQNITSLGVSHEFESDYAGHRQ